MDTILVVDMGTHALRGQPGMHLMVQVLVSLPFTCRLGRDMQPSPCCSRKETQCCGRHACQLAGLRRTARQLSCHCEPGQGRAGQGRSLGHCLSETDMAAGAGP